MNKIKTLMIALVAMATLSCEKDDSLQDVDVITNQGKETISVSEYVLMPGEKIIVPHRNKYIINCGKSCVVNINGGIIYKSGIFVNPTKRRGKL